MIEERYGVDVGCQCLGALRDSYSVTPGSNERNKS